ncbi:MAG: type II secretion system protein [Planctomycetota bacterium]|jgi:prepilin-type N-terminal cleavage/methylation domain-containing protein
MNMNKPNKTKRGFTLIELMITIVIAAIVILSITSVIADAQRGLKQMYKRVFSGVVQDAYVTRRTFDRIVRKSSIRNYVIDNDPEATSGDTSLTVYYYNNPQVPGALDGYATFQIVGTDLAIYRGDLDPGTFDPQGTPAKEVLAKDVKTVEFSVLGSGSAIRMVLSLESSPDKMMFTTSAVRHNDW